MTLLLTFLLLQNSFYIDSVELHGIRFFPQERIRRLVDKELPFPAEKSAIERLIFKILKLYADNGYPLAKVEPLGVDLKSNGKGIFSLKIDEGTLVIVDSVVVEGLDVRVSQVLSHTIWPQSKLFRQNEFTRRIDPILRQAELNLRSVSFIKAGHRYLLKLGLERENRDMVSGTAAYEKEHGLVGSVNVSLTSALGGLRSLDLQWNRQSMTDQMIHIEAVDPLILGNWVGVKLIADYEATGARVFESVDAGIQKIFIGSESRLYVGMHYESGEVREQSLSWEVAYKFFRAKGEQSRHRTKLMLAFQGKFLSTEQLTITGRVEYRDIKRWKGDVLVQDMFRIGGPEDFKGVRPGELLFAHGFWAGSTLSHYFGGLAGYVFANSGRFDSSWIMRFGFGLTSKGIDISVAFPTKLVTISLAYRF